MEMKKCKECGKLFMPKSMRSQYCDDLHYRPCPVCGKKVEAKYLSDPPRCCSKECQQVMRKNTASKSTKPASAVAKPTASKSLTLGTSLPGTPQLLDPPKTRKAGPQPVEEMFGYFAFGSGDENAWLEAIYDYEDMLREHYVCATFINKKKILNFIPGHEYALEITREPDRPYLIHAVYDFKSTKKVDLHMTLSSWISVNQNFTKAEVHINEDGTLEVLGDGQLYGIE